jgi:DNA polymerase zeta
MAIKLICNVIYGYYGAGGSGRMPCIEIADAVVSTARATIKFISLDIIHFFFRRTISYIEDEYHLPVIYGDTDSVFIEFPQVFYLYFLTFSIEHSAQRSF